MLGNIYFIILFKKWVKTAMSNLVCSAWADSVLRETELQKTRMRGNTYPRVVLYLSVESALPTRTPNVTYKVIILFIGSNSIFFEMALHVMDVHNVMTSQQLPTTAFKQLHIVNILYR